MDGKLPFEEAKILEAISNGTVTKEKLEGGLIALINAEMEQNQRPANMELLNACQSLICRLNNYQYISSKEKSLEDAKKRLVKADRMKTLRLNAIRVAAIVVVIVTGGFTIDLLLREESLKMQPTADEQQIEVKGLTREGVFIPDGHANDGNQVNIIGSEELNAAAGVVGYYPNVPTWLPEGWKPLDYYATASRFVSIFRMRYQHTNENNYVKFTVAKYNDVEAALASFQQNQDGESFEWRDTTVYLSLNIAERIAVWLEGSTCYSLSGPLTQDEIEQIIKSIQRSDTKNEE